MWTSAHRLSRTLALAALLTGPGASILRAQPETGTIQGTVTLADTGAPLHNADILIVELSRRQVSADDGTFTFENVPPGIYQVIAHLDGLFTEDLQLAQVTAGQTATLNYMLSLGRQQYEITVTASATEETTFESFNAVESLDAYDLAQNANVSLGEVLSNNVGSGIAKRGFGPGAARPIIRGFDGDRVLVMQDGIRTGTLSSQSGDHGEALNMAQMERLEVVKGPATLLYSGSAMGGTVNAISRHQSLNFHPHEGLRGFSSGTAGSTNAMGGISAGFEYGKNNWMIWGQGGGVRSGDYGTPAGTIPNSRTRLGNGGAGIGWYGERTFFSFETNYADGAYGVPFANELHGAHDHEDEDADHEDEEDGDHEDEADHDHEEELDRISLDTRRENYRAAWGLNNLTPAFESFLLKVDYTKWRHDEVEFFEDGDSDVATRFNQDQFVYRGVFEQTRRGLLSGRFGFWGIHRQYDVTGEEALSPPVDHNGFAVFGLEEVELERMKFQFGARLENNRYTPAFAQRGPGVDDGGQPIADAVKRSFTGASASAGWHTDTWRGGAFVVNYAHSNRAPALEELYNYGPHVGNLAFEIGDPALKSEIGNGFDLSLRHNSPRWRGEANFFYYRFSNFIFPFANGELDDGLPVIQFTQRNARYRGAEAILGLALHPYLWLNLGLDQVNAKDVDTGTFLPRIPPLRGKIGLEYTRGTLEIKPELILASDQSNTFTGETRTAGYAVMNLNASYTYATQHVAHQFSVNVFNVGDRLYRNHSSFIKDRAPEIGRGIKFTYMVRLF